MNADQKNVTRSAGIVGIAVMFSRILGLIREQLIAYFFGSGVASDAFYAAFRIPNLMRDLFGEGVLSKAFVATFTATEVEDGESQAWRLANHVFNAIAIILTILTLIGILISPTIVDLMFIGKGFDVELDPSSHFGFESKRQLTVHLTRIMFPFLMMVSLAAIAMGLLNSKRRFGVPATASSFFNVTSISIGILGYFYLPRIGWHPVIGMAIGVVIGGAMQFLIQIPSMIAVGFRYRPIISFRDRRVRQVLRLIVPAILGVAATQINVFVNGMFASHRENWLSWINWAFRLMHLPIGVFGVAISTAALPNLARFVAQNEIDRFRESLNFALRLVFLLTIPSAIGLMILSKPICRLIFEIGKNTPHDTIQIAGALFFYAIGLVGYSGVKIITDGFYAFNDTKTPVKVSLISVAINIFLNYVFIFRFDFDHRSLALATACSITINFLTLLFLLSRRVGGLQMDRIGFFLIKILIASFAMAICCYFENNMIESFLGIESLTSRIIGVFLPIVVGILMLIGVAKLLNIRETNQIISLIIKR